MRKLRQFGVLVLLGLISLSPAIACETPSALMTPAERACCRMMHNQCDQMDMSASRGCCKSLPSNVYAAPPTKVEILLRLVIPVSGLIQCELLSPFSSSREWVEHHNYSPPNSPTSTVSILRI